jgi:lipopolysaccharide transport system ATP-binding protein
MGHISVKNVGKAYKRYHRKIARVAEWFGFGIRHELKWVLHDISFEVKAGDAIGVIGINGAGKSTLLKIITGTARPTVGSVHVGGRIAALLELGMGFHPDFTGRQNVYMAGQLHGLSSSDIGARMQEIEDFAEIGDYIDQPVRTYSSGMQVRLAFSVATAVRPEILIVDEALSVGDAYFQHKSFDRIRSFREQGTTLLFVSHDPGAVKTLCNRAILIDKGRVAYDGEPNEVLDYYNAMIARKEASDQITQSEQFGGGKITRSGSQRVVIDKVDLLVDQVTTRAVASHSAVMVRVSCTVHLPVEELTVGILMRDRLGNDVFGTNTFHHANSSQNPAAGSRFQVDFAFSDLALGLGTYSIAVALHKRDAHVADNYDWWDRALVFAVTPADNANIFVGVCNLPVNVHWGRQSDADAAAATATATVSAPAIDGS